MFVAALGIVLVWLEGESKPYLENEFVKKSF